MTKPLVAALLARSRPLASAKPTTKFGAVFASLAPPARPAEAPSTRPPVRDAKTGERMPRREPDDAAFDPVVRSLASPLGPPADLPAPGVSPSPSTAASSAMPAEVQTLALAVVEQAAFWGDGHKGLARLRFGTKARAGLAASTVTLEHDGDGLVVRADDPEIEALLRDRLAARGLTLSGET